MSQSTFGKKFTVTTWGESHGKALGAVVDGVPAGLFLTETDIQAYLDRRKPGQSRYTTARNEGDEVEILSGVFEGQTTGTPFSLIVRNKDQRSHDYGNIANTYRPGHADFGFDSKYGIRDYRGGGRSSGRETIGRVAAGAIAAKILKELGITLQAYTSSIGPVSCQTYHPEVIKENSFYMPDMVAAKNAIKYLESCMRKNDSAGGVIECRINGVPAGIGDPVFGKLDAAFAQALMSIGAVKAVEIGDGAKVSTMRGSENNDGFHMENGRIVKNTNHSGGILGGMSDGSPVVLRAAFKPTPSISRPQQTVNRAGEEVETVIKGRHDPVIMPRAVVVVEAMTALTVLDLMMDNMTARVDYLKQIYTPK